MSSDTPPALYTCIAYPGIVKNEEKMLETLGGIETITEAMTTRNRRLELRFRPGDIYARPTYGDKHSAISFLLKVKVKKKKAVSSPSLRKENTDTSTDVICEPSFIGRVETIFKFSNLCDFQYLPVEKTADGTMKNIYRDLMPEDFPTSEWFQLPMSHFLPPAIYSRMDTIQSYFFKQQEKSDGDGVETPESLGLIGRTRRRRTGYAIFITFDVPSVPCKPRPSALKVLELKFLAKDHYEKIKQCFERRPIWSKTALVYETKYTHEQIKILLPSVAYFFVTGPFRVMWVRIGYDPRKDPSSRIYQTLDYRIPSKGGLSRRIKAKRKADFIQRHHTASANNNPRTLNMNEEECRIKGQLHENTYIFRRGLNPPSRQMFYQYCDVKVPEVEEMFARLPKLTPDAECDRQRGWLPPGFLERCREIITNIIVGQLGNDQDENPETDLDQKYESKQDDENEEEYDDDDDEDEDDYVAEAYDNDYDDNTVFSDNELDDL